MKVYVDPELCISCGLCTSIAPEVFELGDDGFAEADNTQAEENRDEVEEAIDSCPTDAIKREATLDM